MREIVFEPEFEQDLKDIEPDPKRADEMLLSVSKRLATNPGEIGIVQDGDYFWTVTITGKGIIADIGLYSISYLFDEEKVYLIGIERIA